VRAVNLLPKDDAQRSRRQQNIPAVVSTGLIVLVTGLLGLMYFTSKSTAQAKDLEYQDAQAELALLPSPADIAAKNAPQQKLKGEHDARVGALSAALTKRVAWDRILREISLVLPEDVWLSSWAAATPTPASGATAPASAAGQPPTLMTIEGYTYSHESVARLLTRLSVIPDLRNVWLTKSSRGALAGRPIVSFTILADVRAAGAASS
jgi:Tfp pilus assembly protein PilN